MSNKSRAENIPCKLIDTDGIEETEGKLKTMEEVETYLACVDINFS